MSDILTNMKLWNSVCVTDPSHTKNSSPNGHKITSIAPQSQILSATEQFGPYGSTWGFESIDLDNSLIEFGLVTFKGVFFYPGGKFPIINSAKLYKDNAKTKIDDDYAKKIETDTLTKALSKIGFNADVFMGMYDDVKYVEDLKRDKQQKQDPVISNIIDMVNQGRLLDVHQNWESLIINNWNNIPGDFQVKLNEMIKRPVTTTKQGN